MRSRAEEEWGLKAVGEPSFKITRLLSSEKSMMCLPLQSVEEEPHALWCALKSPQIKTSSPVGSWEKIFCKSDLSKG